MNTDTRPNGDEAAREAFEAWARSRGYQHDELDRCRIGIVGPEYYNANTEETWKAWQAALAASRTSGEAGVATDVAQVIAGLREELESSQQALSDLANHMSYRGNSVSFIYQKADAYRAAIDRAFQALGEFGVKADGKTELCDLIRAALASQPQGVSGEEGTSGSRAVAALREIKEVARLLASLHINAEGALASSDDRHLRVTMGLVAEQIVALHSIIVGGELPASAPQGVSLSDERVRAALKPIILDVMDWGRSYGTRLNLDDMTRNDVSDGFADKAARAIESELYSLAAPGQSINRNDKGGHHASAATPGHDVSPEGRDSVTNAQVKGGLNLSDFKRRVAGFTNDDEARMLLRRATAQLTRWHELYGQHNQPWLPPAGDVRLQEDITDFLAAPGQDDVLEALDLDPESYRSEGGTIKTGKLRATIRHPAAPTQEVKDAESFTLDELAIACAASDVPDSTFEALSIAIASKKGGEA